MYDSQQKMETTVKPLQFIILSDGGQTLHSWNPANMFLFPQMSLLYSGSDFSKCILDACYVIAVCSQSYVVEAAMRILFYFPRVWRSHFPSFLKSVIRVVSVTRNQNITWVRLRFYRTAPYYCIIWANTAACFSLCAVLFGTFYFIYFYSICSSRNKIYNYLQ